MNADTTASTRTVAEIAAASPETIGVAVARLTEGRLVSFPTETVYGLGADATNDRAVAKIFKAKQRPSFNPLICHFADIDSVHAMLEIPGPAQKLAARFWPGSLSIVVPRPTNCPISRLASAGLDTIAVRVPDHPVATELLRVAGIPVAAPSANRSGRLSPTRAKDVMASLGDQDVMVLDGGPCRIGVESTVVAIAPDGPVELMREGGISREALEVVLGTAIKKITTPDSVRSPGMLARHYEPQVPLRLDATDTRGGEILLCLGPLPSNAPPGSRSLSPTGDLTEAAANLFAALHDAETMAVAGIAVSPIPDQGLGRAINDRLRRGANG